MNSVATKFVTREAKLTSLPGAALGELSRNHGVWANMGRNGNMLLHTHEAPLVDQRLLHDSLTELQQQQQQRQILESQSAKRQPCECAFITGYTYSLASSWPGLSCVVKRFLSHGSVRPLFVAVPQEDVKIVTDRLPKDVNVVAWPAGMRFPYVAGQGWHRGRTAASSATVMNKLHILGWRALARTLVWIDFDVLLMRPMDELCSAVPQTVGSFAAALNSGYEPRTCWFDGRTFNAGERCNNCSHHGLENEDLGRSVWVAKSVQRQKASSRSLAAPPPCMYEFNSGVFVVRPLDAPTFHQAVLEPIRHALVPSRDGSDQGTINTLVRRGALGGAVVTLNTTYNVLHRVRFVRPLFWLTLSPAAIHFSGVRKPWGAAALAAHARSNRSWYLQMERLWRQHCGALG